MFFPNEPVVRVTAPLPEAQLIDFRMRRAHGSEAAILAARASYLVGFAGTATVLAHPLFGIPIFGTMAHSFIQTHDSESEAFEHFCASQRGPIVLLIDTSDTKTGAARVVDLAQQLAPGSIRAVRLDSGDLADLSRSVRNILDDGGCRDIQIFASGSLDEHRLDELRTLDAPIDAYGIGTSLDVSEDCPALDCVYKVQEYAGRARRKRSHGKATWPGRKQVYRTHDKSGRITNDVLTLVGHEQQGEPLLKPILRGGKRVTALPDLENIRNYARQQADSLPAALRVLDRHTEFAVTVASAVQKLAEQVDREFN